MGFHEKFGFNLVGIYHKVGYKLGKYHDVGWWELHIGDGQAPPVDITPVSELCETKVWDEAMRHGLSLIN